MKIEVEIEQGCLDKLIVDTLKQEYFDCKEFLSFCNKGEDRILAEALKRVLEYYGEEVK